MEYCRCNNIPCRLVCNRAVGDTEVYVNDYLNVIISGPGSVYYKGHPAIDVSITGSGQIINAN